MNNYSLLSIEATHLWAYHKIKHDIKANTTDEQIAQLIEKYEAEANDQGYTLDDTLKTFMENRRFSIRTCAS